MQRLPSPPTRSFCPPAGWCLPVLMRGRRRRGRCRRWLPEVIGTKVIATPKMATVAGRPKCNAYESSAFNCASHTRPPTAITGPAISSGRMSSRLISLELICDPMMWASGRGRKAKPVFSGLYPCICCRYCERKNRIVVVTGVSNKIMRLAPLRLRLRNSCVRSRSTCSWFSGWRWRWAACRRLPGPTVGLTRAGSRSGRPRRMRRRVPRSRTTRRGGRRASP
jgi:hypothetical protein